MFALMVVSLLCACSVSRYDVVLANGRVIDPESGLDAPRNVAITDGRIVAISEHLLAAKTTVDVAGMVVSPGFIDLHNHSATPMGLRFQALDGVTTSLELEAGAFPLSSHGSALQAGLPLNIGASVGYASIRIAVMASEGDDPITLAHPLFATPASAQELTRMRAMLEQGLDNGGLGIGLPLDYMSEAVGSDELRMIFEVAGRRRVPVFVHIRRGLAGDSAGLEEVIAMARKTAAPVHICHLQHSAMKGTEQFLKLIRQARADGVDISTEMFPYNAGTTTIGAAVFRRNWQEIFDIGYGDVEWAATGERFNEAMWFQHQQSEPAGMVIHHYVDEAWTRQVLREPGVMIVTDGTPVVDVSIKVPPQGIGTYARVLGRYVRDEQVVDLMTALRKMTLLPALRLESMAPIFSRKGRIQVGADADITVFNPATIIDNSTYREPFQASSGVRYVLVNGQFVVRDGEFQEGVNSGRRLSSTPSVAN